LYAQTNILGTVILNENVPDGLLYFERQCLF